MGRIHPTARISEAARIHPDVQVGPYCVVGPHVVLEPGNVLEAHVVIQGPARLGPGNHVFPFACLGTAPQDRKYSGEATRLEVGEGNIIREYVTMNRGTRAGTGVTRVGNGGMFMAHAHVAHDCVVGNGVVLANGVALAGHVEVGDQAVLGGLAAVHQFARVGTLALVGGGAMVSQDVPPYTVAQGDRARLVGLNLVGLKRAGVAPEVVRVLREAYRVLFRQGLARSEALRRVEELGGDVLEVQRLLAFVRSSRRGVCRSHRAG